MANIRLEPEKADSECPPNSTPTTTVTTSDRELQPTSSSDLETEKSVSITNSATSGQSHQPDHNEMIVVYEGSEFDEEEEEELVDNMLLISSMRLFKGLMVTLPTVIVVLIIVGRIEGDTDARAKERIFRGVGIVSIFAVGILFYYLMRYGICEGLFIETTRRADIVRAEERQRRREELKLQARDPWKRKLISQPKKPYFNHVELYKQTGLYKEQPSRY